MAKNKKKFSKKLKNEKFSKDVISKSKNDISWYNRYPDLTKISGLVNEFKPLGSYIDYNEGTIDQVTGSTWIPKSMPGMLSLLWIPTPGISTSSTSPVNMACYKLFTNLRLKQFSTSVYDPADVGMYFLAMDSIFAMYAYMCQVYVHMRSYNFVNQYEPKVYAAGLRVDYNDVVDNLDDFLFYINLCKEKLSVIRVPKSMDYIARHIHMSSHIYKDADIDKAQLFAFVPAYLWQYSAKTASLFPVNVANRDIGDHLLTVSDMKTIMNNLMEAILPDEDMNIIAADIQKYVEGDYWTVQSLDWTAMEQPIYNEGMAWQIHNAKILPVTDLTELAVSQQTDASLNTYLYFNPRFNTTEWGCCGADFVDSKVNNPSAEEIVESTRLKFTVKSIEYNSNDMTMRLGTCGSELLIGGYIFQTDPQNVFNQGEMSIYVWDYTQYCRFVGTGTSVFYMAFACGAASDPIKKLGPDIASLILTAQFNNAPIIWLVDQPDASSKTGVKNILAPISQIENLIGVSHQQLEALDTMCMLSLFDGGTGK